CTTPAATVISPLSLHDALPIYAAVCLQSRDRRAAVAHRRAAGATVPRARRADISDTALPHQAGGIWSGRPGGRRPDQLYSGNARDRKSTRLNSSHVKISYAVFC